MPPKPVEAGSQSSPIDTDRVLRSLDRQRETRRRLYEEFTRSIAELDPLPRAERWLQYQAENLELIEDQEAVVYLASRGFDVLRYTESIRENWKWRAKTAYEQRYDPAGGRRPPAARAEKLKLRQPIADPEIEELSEFELPNFWMVPDGHEHIADAVMLRTAEACDLAEFAPWFRRLERSHREVVLREGIEPVAASLSLFSLLRANRAVRDMGDVLKRLLESLELSENPNIDPWQVTSVVVTPTGRQHRLTPRIDYAATLSLAAIRLYGDPNRSVSKRALNFLLSAQDPVTGAWRISPMWRAPSIETTAAVLHALCLAQPRGWRSAATRGSRWLWAQQRPDGYWAEDVSPYPVYLTVLVLDALSLAEGSGLLTFSQTLTVGPRRKPTTKREPGKSDSPSKIPAIRDVSSRETLDRPDVLIVVATQRELRRALEALKPPSGKRRIIRASRSNLTFYFGRIGRFRATIVLSGMGSGGIRGSLNSIEQAIGTTRPRAVIGLGIAFGADPGKQELVDVLVSSSVALYEPARVGREKIQRGPRPEASALLVDRFSNYQGWTFKGPGGSQPKVHIGLLLSGEKLVDEPGFKARLLKSFPEAVGGEMEGAGVYAACERGPEKTHWIVVKSIADWADGRKSNEFQDEAAAAAVSLVAHVLERQTALDGIRKQRGLVKF